MGVAQGLDLLAEATPQVAATMLERRHPSPDSAEPENPFAPKGWQEGSADTVLLGIPISSGKTFGLRGK